MSSPCKPKSSPRLRPVNIAARKNVLPWQKITECDSPTPDYKIVLNVETVIVEVKQIDKDDKFTMEYGSRIVGDHIRAKINDARKQAKAALKCGLPFILLVYNNLDPMQASGTEQHDFIEAMYGESTVVLSKKDHSITDTYHGRNQSLRIDKNTSFSAIGFLYQTSKETAVRIYENTFAENKLDFSSLPKCFEAIQITLV